MFARVRWAPWVGAMAVFWVLGLSVGATPGAAATTGIKTTNAFEEPDARMVKWIDWDSPFRHADLRIGDWIVGVQGERYQGDRKNTGIGEVSEERFWEERGLGPGDPVTVTVDRDGRVFEIEGRLREAEVYKDANGARWLSPEGPPARERDGFRSPWSIWYDDFEEKAEFVIGNALYVGIDTESELKRIEESDFAERIAFLEQNYPGPFAEAVRGDYETMLTILRGEPRMLTDEDLEYRRLGELRIAQVGEAGDAALDAFAAEVGGDLIAESFPLPDIAEGDLTPYVGKLVRLPKVGRRQLIFESEAHSTYSFFRAGSDREGYYLVDRLEPAMKSAYFAVVRYEDKVSPDMRYLDFEFFGRIKETPVLAYDVITDKLYTGLAVAPVAAMVVDQRDSDRRFFVDLRGAKEEKEDPWDGSEGPAPWTVLPKATLLPFAGEDDLLTLDAPPVTDDSPPEEVLHAFFERMKFTDFEGWKALFADWDILTFVGPEPVVVAQDIMNENDVARFWNSSRKKLMGEVYDLEVYHVGRIRRVYEGSPIDGSADGTSVVDEVSLMVMPVGKFDDKFHTYQHPRIKRKWSLQRLDGGPWRVSDTRPL